MQAIPRAQVFPDPYNDGAVMAAWEGFLSGQSGRSDSLRSLVDGSWRRCQDAKVDPGKHQGPPPVSEQIMHCLRGTHGELLDASAPVMAYARDFLAETGTIMVLADTSGTILSMEGDTPTVGSAQNIHLMPGANWSEPVCGTNAIGTALELGDAVQIHSAEHYCAGIKRWTCSATVIRHPSDGEVLGVVDVSGLSDSYSRQSLALVVQTASRIESRLAAREMELRFRLLESAMRRWSVIGNDGLVLFDRRGYPIKANELAESAIAALGGELNLSTPQRIGALSLGDGAATDLPEWIDPSRLQPITHRGERLGTLLALPPSRPTRRRSIVQSADSGQTAKPTHFSSIITRHPALISAVGKASQLARSKVPVLLLGETGVGKEEFARGIHLASAVADGPYVALNCGGLSRELLASELFGYADGAFTGARRGGMTGKIEAANGGTLFLDEIGEMPVDLQPHLLRVLEQGEIHRLGENVPRKVTFRLVAATNRNLREEVSAGRFRMDFYYRVAVTTIHLPALRQRREDIRPLAQHFLDRFAAIHGQPGRILDEALLERLEAYDWPGNVRELRNVIESALLMSENPVIGVDELPREIIDLEPAGDADTDRSSVCRIADGESGLIRKALAATGGNLTQAARELDIAKSTLYLKLRRYGLEAEVHKVRRSGQPAL